MVKNGNGAPYIGRYERANRMGRIRGMPVDSSIFNEEHWLDEVRCGFEMATGGDNVDRIRSNQLHCEYSATRPNSGERVTPNET